jgi:hypothetical protein
LLLDGELMTHGLLSHTPLEQALNSTISRGVGDVAEICEAVILESWLRTIHPVNAHAAL